MDCIKEIVGRLRESRFFEMSNIRKDRTGLPYDLWVDSLGSSRNIEHNLPRVKFNIDGDLVPFSIEDSPKILIDEEVRHHRDLIKFIKDNKDILLKHWNHEIDDGQIINYLTYVYRKGMSRDEAYSKVSEED